MMDPCKKSLKEGYQKLTTLCTLVYFQDISFMSFKTKTRSFCPFFGVYEIQLHCTMSITKIDLIEGGFALITSPACYNQYI